MTSRVFIALRVPADPGRAFEAFTREIASWWQPNRLFQITPHGDGELAFEPGVAQAGADMPLTAILRSGDLDQLTTHAQLAVGRPAVTVPEDLAGSSRYRPPPRRPASRTAALAARNGPPHPKGLAALELISSPVHDDPGAKALPRPRINRSGAQRTAT